MAKKLYVGVDSGSGEKYLSSYPAQSGIITRIMTNTSYTSYIGFELDFTYYGGSGNTASYHHILNAGGTGSGTKFCLSIRSNKLILEGSKGGHKITLYQNVPITRGTRYIISNRIDPTTKTAHFKVMEKDTGTTIVDSDIYTVSSLTQFGVDISVFNTGVISQNRATYMDLYSLKLYDSEGQTETLLENIIPTGTTSGDDGSLYDTVNQTTLEYNPSDITKAVYYYSGGDAAKEASKVYVGVNGEAKEVVKAYVGVNGEAKLFYDTTS